MRKLVPILSLALLLTAGSASAQMKFLKDGQSGFGLGAGYLVGEDFTGFGATADYTVRSAWDLGVDVDWLSLDDEVNGSDAKATRATPWLAIGLVRPKETAKFGAELQIRYEFDSFSGGTLEELGLDASATALTGLASVYMRLESSPTLLIYPEANLGYMSGTRKVEDEIGTDETDIEEMVYGISVSALFNDKVRVTPSFRSIDGNSTWTLMLGLLLPGS